MSDPRYGGNFSNPDGGLYIPAHELRPGLRQQPASDGDDDGHIPAGAGAKLDQESFLSEAERRLVGGVGAGPLNPNDPTNDA